MLSLEAYLLAITQQPQYHLTIHFIARVKEYPDIDFTLTTAKLITVETRCLKRSLGDNGRAV